MPADFARRRFSALSKSMAKTNCAMDCVLAGAGKAQTVDPLRIVADRVADEGGPRVDVVKVGRPRGAPEPPRPTYVVSSLWACACSGTVRSSVPAAESHSARPVSQPGSGPVG